MRGNNTVYKTLAGESRSVESKKLSDLKNDQLLHEIKEYDLCDIYNINHTGPLFNQKSSKSLTLETCATLEQN